MHLENRLRCTEKAHPETKGRPLCIYKINIQQKEEKQGEQRKKRIGEWKRREDICVYISMIVFMTRIITPCGSIHHIMYRYTGLDVGSVVGDVGGNGGS